MIARHAFTTDEWHRMGELGLFDQNARVELLDGDIIDMTPIGSRHAGTVNRLNRLLLNDYTLSHAEPDEILLLIEVSDSSLAYDRDRKAPYYARVGIRECWIVDLTHGEVLVLRSPAPTGYQVIERRRVGERLTVDALAGVFIDVADLLDPTRH